MSKKTKLKARSMWATKDFFARPGIAEKLLRDDGLQFHHKMPVVVIAVDDPEALKELVARALYHSFGLHRPWDKLEAWERDDKRKDASRALVALGLPPR